MEIDDHIDFLYMNYFVTIHKCNHNKHYIFQLFMSLWTLEFLENDCRGQNPLDWGVIYINRKILKCRCLKWAPMAHLDISNTSYGQKKGRESNWQFDSRPLKVTIAPISLCSGGVPHTVGKLYLRGTTLLQTSSQSEVFTQSYGPPKLQKF